MFCLWLYTLWFTCFSLFRGRGHRTYILKMLHENANFLWHVLPSQQVVIMLVLDKENDRVLLSRQSRFVPRMWSCLAGFMEVYGVLLISKQAWINRIIHALHFRAAAQLVLLIYSIAKFSKKVAFICLDPCGCCPWLKSEFSH